MRRQQRTDPVRPAPHLPVLSVLIALDPGARAGRALLPQTAIVAA